MADNVVSQVTFEIGQIDQLLAVYADLVERVQQRPPDLVEITAMASVLRSFYNGLENIFLSIAKGLDEQVPIGDRWHRDLLIHMTRETANRGSVISTALAQKLADYWDFGFLSALVFIFSGVGQVARVGYFFAGCVGASERGSPRLPGALEYSRKPSAWRLTEKLCQSHCLYSW